MEGEVDVWSDEDDADYFIPEDADDYVDVLAGNEVVEEQGADDEANDADDNVSHVSSVILDIDEVDDDDDHHNNPVRLRLNRLNPGSVDMSIQFWPRTSRRDPLETPNNELNNGQEEDDGHESIILSDEEYQPPARRRRVGRSPSLSSPQTPVINIASSSDDNDDDDYNSNISTARSTDIDGHDSDDSNSNNSSVSTISSTNAVASASGDDNTTANNINRTASHQRAGTAEEHSYFSTSSSPSVDFSSPGNFGHSQRYVVVPGTNVNVNSGIINVMSSSGGFFRGIDISNDIEVNDSSDTQYDEDSDIDVTETSSNAPTLSEDSSSDTGSPQYNWQDRRLVRRNAIVLEDEDEDDDVVEVIRADNEGPGEDDESGVAGVVHQEPTSDSESASDIPTIASNTNTSDTAETVTNMPASVTIADIGDNLINASKLSNDDEEGLSCLICYEPYTNSGDHRLACLKCGHTYGRNCIEKWIKNEARCPQCNSRASKKDIRIIYVKNLKALDTAERDRAMSDLEKEKEAKRRLELECSKLRQKFQVKEEECQQLTLQFNFLKNRTGGLYRQPGDVVSIGSEISNQLPGSSNSSTKYGFHYSRVKVIEMGDCRVGVCNPWLNMLTVSQSVKSPLYPHGIHGIRRINLLDMKTTQTTSLHQKEIRDLSFSTNQSDLLLSVGMDRKAILTNCNSNVTIQTYQTDSPLWSCAWNELSQYIFYIGTANGNILSFDIRKPNEVLKTITIPSDEDRSPVARLLFINPSYTNLDNKFSLCGLVVQKFNSVWFWELRRDSDSSTGGEQQGRFHQLPVEGPFLSTDFEPVSRHLLISTRPSLTKANGEGKHMICQLSQYYSDPQECNVCSCNIIHSFPNQVNLSKMCRSSIYSIGQQQQGTSNTSNPRHNNVLVGANAPRNQINIWSISDTNWKQTLNLTEPVLDFVPCSVNSTHLLGMVTNSAVHLFKDNVN